MQFEALHPRDHCKGHSLKKTQKVHSAFTKRILHFNFSLFFFFLMYFKYQAGHVHSIYSAFVAIDRYSECKNTML